MRFFVILAILPLAAFGRTLSEPALAADRGLLAADESAALAPSFVWKPLPGLTWQTTGAAKIENGVLTVDLDRVGEAYAQAEIDLSGYDGKAFELAAVVETKGVADAPKSYLGYRFAVNYLDMSQGGDRPAAAAIVKMLSDASALPDVSEAAGFTAEHLATLKRNLAAYTSADALGRAKLIYEKPVNMANLLSLLRGR